MTTTQARTITLDEFHEEARARFGEDRNRWAYQCPVCGGIATITDVRLALALETVAHGPHTMTAEQVLGQNCVHCPADARDHGTTTVRTPDGRTARVFELAPKP
ncbi:VVA0879 family protein [Nocardiopsis dassonvillei]|uniref:VVA0879 family protein n=1 Tax=Nocardiopsis dassonvillei TaxID=2014 RepID=UPI00157DCD70|nr:VVA0879 family protein [Nocardiopsis dassonvillei]